MSRPKRVFGVVVPVPAQLSRIADRVRRRYDPNFQLIGPHVTVLPPRPLPLTRRQVREVVRRVAERMTPFDLQLGGVRTFRPVMPVAFVRLRRGGEALKRLHLRLARGPLRGPEAFPYVPHLTVGQDLDDGRLREVLALSRRLFSPSAAASSWRAEFLIIVERRSPRRWISLSPLPLQGVAAKRSSPLRRPPRG